MHHVRAGLLSVLVLFAAAWLAGDTVEEKSVAGRWTEITPGVLRSNGIPCGYALVEGDAAVLLGAPRGVNLETLRKRGVTKIDFCLLTHHHRDTSAAAQRFLDAGIPVRAPKASADLLLPDGVKQFWKTSLAELPAGQQPGLRDRTFNLFSYLVHPQGIEGIDCRLEDGQTIDWCGWTLRAIATPGHSRDHTAFVATKNGKPMIVFCGDAIASPGRMWSPYSTDWDHWTDAGLKAAAESLRKLADLKPAILCPEHGAPITTNVVAALETTAKNAAEAGFLKSFERFSKDRLGNAPAYAFLAKDQVATAGEKPWTRVSEHLFLTGNTYVLVSRAGPILVIDPFGQRVAEQVRTLQRDEKLGPVEVALISHAHNDHYTGAFQLPERDKFQIWTLDLVARPLAEPFRYCAPFLDPRPLKIDRVLKEGEAVTWREYTFRVGHFPGQSYFTTGVQTVIDGRTCYHTADNFFHHDQFAGSGGWSGRNRGWPLLYAQSAQAVLDAKPEWVLAEHGGPFVFDAEDFRRRVQWGRAAASAMDALSPTGQHRRAWNPTRVQVEPLLLHAKAGGTVTAHLVIDNPLPRPETLTLTLDGGKLLPEMTQVVTVPAGETLRRELMLNIPPAAPAGRHVIPLVIVEGEVEEGCDAFLVLDLP